MEEKEVSPQEARIRSITKLYYSKPEVQKALLEFGAHREVVPRYFEGFGKRPDTLVYPADIMSLVSRGATSFHGSEEIWSDPLQISSDMHPNDLNALRSSWDLLIDIDSPYLDYSKVAANLVIEILELHGITNYGIKFSGKKGFHIIVPGAAFPEEYQGTKRNLAFPEWPRAITEYMLNAIKPKYNKKITELGIDLASLEQRTKKSREELVQTTCPKCSHAVENHNLVKMRCDRCKILYERPDFKITKKRIRCTTDTCPGFFDVIEEKEFWKCSNCGTSNRRDEYVSTKKTTYSNSSSSYAENAEQEIAGDKLGSLDLVLVSSRHLFRMPYSLHEKTSLASVVMPKSKISSFTPRDADPFRAVILPYYPQIIPGQGTRLLELALEWKAQSKSSEEKFRKENLKREPIALTGVKDEMFPEPIKKLLKGLTDGRKRGLFVLLTFLRCSGFSTDEITARLHEWNEKNQPPLKEGYVKSQLDWMFKQKKQILPPNYDNPSFYKDLGLLDKEPSAKNPIVEVMRKVKFNSSSNFSNSKSL